MMLEENLGRSFLASLIKLAVIQVLTLHQQHFERRIRCISHVINLVARSLLFGKEPEALEEKLTQSNDIEL